MPLPSSAILVVRPIILCQSQQISNLTYWEPASGTITQGQMQAIADAASTGLAAIYLPLMASEDTFVGCQVTFHNSGTQYDAYSTMGHGAGSNGDTSMGPSVAIIIRKVTGNSGRDMRGRYFIGPVSEAICDDGYVTPGETSVKAMASFFGADKTWDAITFHARHWDRKTSTMVPISECIAMAKVSSRRDRRKRLAQIPV